MSSGRICTAVTICVHEFIRNRFSFFLTQETTATQMRARRADLPSTPVTAVRPDSFSGSPADAVVVDRARLMPPHFVRTLREARSAILIKTGPYSSAPN